MSRSLRPNCHAYPKRHIALAGALILLSLAVLLTVLPPDVTISWSRFTFLSFRTHAYARVATAGFALLGAGGLVYGSTLLTPATQAVAVAAVLSAIAVSQADNLLSFFIFWEMLAWLTFLLVLMGQRLSRPLLATSFTYLLTHLVGGLALLVGFARQYAITGSLAVTQLDSAALPWVAVAVAIKAAFIPLNYWIPAAYPAATYPASVFLSGLCTKVGVLAITRLLGPHLFIAYMGGAMALWGVVFALLQTNLRRLLSWHIVSQVGYMVACMGWGTAAATNAGLLHVFNHILYKGALFMAAGCVLYGAGTEDLKELKGTARPPLLVTTAALFAALSISGVPPFNGFISKTLIKYAVEAPVLGGMLALASVGTAASFSKFMHRGFLASSPSSPAAGMLPPRSMQWSLATLASLCLLTGVFPQLITGNLLPYTSAVPVYGLSSLGSALGSVLLGVTAYAGLTSLGPRLRWLWPLGQGLVRLEQLFTAWFEHPRLQQALAGMGQRVLVGSRQYQRMEHMGLTIVMVAVALAAILWIILLG